MFSVESPTALNKISVILVALMKFQVLLLMKTFEIVLRSPEVLDEISVTCRDTHKTLSATVNGNI